LSVGRSLQLIPNLIELFELQVAKLFAALANVVFQRVEARDKLLRCRFQRGLRVQFALPRQIRDGKQQVADFIFDRALIA
jgi:hypothetical protein